MPKPDIREPAAVDQLVPQQGGGFAALVGRPVAARRARLASRCSRSVTRLPQGRQAIQAGWRLPWQVLCLDHIHA
jgi:hypothetical protein